MRIIAAVMLFGAVSTTALAGEIVIGLVLPPTESEARCIQQGAELAIEEFNQRSHARAARLAIRGQAGQWGTAAGEAGQLVSEDGALALIAPTDGAVTHLVLQVAGKTGVPVISLSPDSSVTTSGVLNVARIVPDRVTETSFVFTHARAGGSKRPLRWAAILPTGRTGRECAADIVKASAATHTPLNTPVEVERASKRETNLLERLSVPHHSRDGRARLSERAVAAIERTPSVRSDGEEAQAEGEPSVRQSANADEPRSGGRSFTSLRGRAIPAPVQGFNARASSSENSIPEAIFIAHDAATTMQLAIELRAQGFKGVLAGPSQLFSHAFAPQAHTELAGFLIATPAACPSDPFARAFESRFGRKADLAAAMAYDAARLLVQSLASARSADVPLRPLASTVETGATGEIKFDAHGNRVAALQLNAWRTNQFEPLK